MMMDRERMGCWAKAIAIGLAVVFLGSFVILGIGSNVTYNLFDLIGDQQSTGQTTDTGNQIQAAREELDRNPEDPEAIRTLAALYVQNNQLEEAERVLQRGREVAPRDAEIALLLGQVYAQQAQTAPQEEQRELYSRAGDAFAAAAEIEPENEDALYFAGQAYDQAGEPAEAIKYWNTYLELEPEGEQSEQIRERISSLLEGGGGTTGASGG
ncbi:MAG: tetratricopeptide repeat protein [Actinomycetota bacterium]|nr:tetratricopeptide repeat protein [Actinomycetota bacterium]